MIQVCIDRQFDFQGDRLVVNGVMIGETPQYKEKKTAPMTLHEHL